MRLSTLEKQVLTGIAEDHPQGSIILEQMARARVDEREYSVYGWRAFFSVDMYGRHLDKALWKTEDMPAIYARHPALPTPAKFTLVIADGFISCLEASSHEAGWPKDEGRFGLETQ